MKYTDLPEFLTADASVVFIGHIRTPFTNRGDCPRSTRAARVNGGTARVEVREPFRQGLQGLAAYSHIWLLYWMDEAARDALVQSPAHLPEPRGVFSIRSPARPNPIALASTRLLVVAVFRTRTSCATSGRSAGKVPLNTQASDSAAEQPRKETVRRMNHPGVRAESE